MPASRKLIRNGVLGSIAWSLAIHVLEIDTPRLTEMAAQKRHLPLLVSTRYGRSESRKFLRPETDNLGQGQARSNLPKTDVL
jgi:hypothetical protein